MGTNIADLEHYFCSCEKTRPVWAWVRLKILGLCDQGLVCSNWNLLNLFLPRTHFEQEIVWLVSNFVEYVWVCIFIKNSEIRFEKFFGFLCFKYKMDRNSFGIRLAQILGLG